MLVLISYMLFTNHSLLSVLIWIVNQCAVSSKLEKIALVSYKESCLFIQTSYGQGCGFFSQILKIMESHISQSLQSAFFKLWFPVILNYKLQNLESKTIKLIQDNLVQRSISNIEWANIFQESLQTGCCEGEIFLVVHSHHLKLRY